MIITRFSNKPGFLSLSDTTCQCHRSRHTDSALSQGENLPITRTGQAASQYKLVQNQRWSSPPKSRLQGCFPAASLCQLCRPARPFYCIWKYLETAICRGRTPVTRHTMSHRLNCISILANVCLLSTSMDTCLVLPLGLLNKLANKHSVGERALISLSAAAHWTAYKLACNFQHL